MRAIIETGTDVASVCFFDPAALPPTFGDATREDLMTGNRSLVEEGRVWCQDTGADGGYLFHFYVEEQVPEHIQRHASDPQRLKSFRVPSGTIWACGTEYAALDPGKAGLDKFQHMGQKFVLPSGTYTMTVWRTEWSDAEREAAMRKRCSKQALRWEARLGPATGILFMLTALATIAAGIQTLPLFWRGGWKPEVSWVWVGLLSAWVLFACLAVVLTRMERSPARREAEREFPSVVVQMQRIAA